jgi:hypothetical protein
MRLSGLTKLKLFLRKSEKGEAITKNTTLLLPLVSFLLTSLISSLATHATQEIYPQVTIAVLTRIRDRSITQAY